MFVKFHKLNTQHGFLHYELRLPMGLRETLKNLQTVIDLGWFTRDREERKYMLETSARV